MQFAVKKGSVLLTLIAAVMATMAIASPAQASPFCGGQWVNNASSCFGAQRAMSGANAYGTSTGVCVGASNTRGTCAPTNHLAVVNVPYGQYVPWVHGTASNLTQTWGNTW
jgi:hypothetical protein